MSWAIAPRTGLALSMKGRHDEAIAILARTVTLSRAPISVGVLDRAWLVTMVTQAPAPADRPA